MVATTSIVVCTPPFKTLNAAVPKLKPWPAESTAVMKIVAPFAGLVMLQHPPQLGEFHATSKAPPTKGELGIVSNVGYLAARPLSPFEHATLLREYVGLSNVPSNAARRGEGVGVAGWGRACATCVKKSARAKEMQVNLNIVNAKELVYEA